MGVGIMEPQTTRATDQRTDFQVLLHLSPVANTDQDLELVAERALAALADGAEGLALGVVASVDLDRRLVELEMTLEASSASEVHQTQALILGALERGGPFVFLDSTTSRSPTLDDTSERELVCA